MTVIMGALVHINHLETIIETISNNLKAPTMTGGKNCLKFNNSKS
jgi:hypothetical protein